MTPLTGNLLFDSISLNTGDIAIGIASAQVLARRGISAKIVDPLGERMPEQMIIGGGELIRPAGDRLYDVFRQTGAHILNSAGVWGTAGGLDYLKDYAYVSARSSREVEVLRRWVPEAEIVPCATTLLQSNHYEIPGVDPGDLLVGIHMVPHSLRQIENLIPLLNSIPHKKVYIPFTHYNGDATFMRHLPFDKANSIFLDTLDPLQLHSVIGQMDRVIVSSLHASIFAYSQNIPFASIFQQKVQNYFEDRGLAAHVVADRSQLRDMIERMDTEVFDFTGAIENDSAALSRAFDRYEGILSRNQGQSGAPSTFEGPSTSLIREQVLLAQAQQVIGDRDLTLAGSESARLAMMTQTEAQTHEAQEASEAAACREDAQEARIADLESRLAQSEDSLTAVTGSLWWSLGLAVPAPLRRALRRLTQMLQRP
ncbi:MULTISPECIES: polysaccharide pyruvyl transferase family protein [Cryobacterium]|uniref:Polysaccharide pyruvyl transferase family protein n=1 Tax=Cryobacterium breve TaxID=1259258 RepID=A0ABY2JA62_9MICO|nr:MULTISPECIES: polysaccharide pyruvyl transferase family protein [Cryobacterium]TFC90425.1 polysaccharide pyruvyl transferase family protein [Cryobacterium sp. TmT3-12]TFD01842.1 polysaccharide pyruvyl transferase family protein [Cryobacterium breve]